MKRIFAPWRSEYIKNTNFDECIFCKASREKEDKKYYVLLRGKFSFVMMNIFPYNNGHIMIAPYKHTGNLSDLTQDELNELMNFTQKWESVLKDAMNPHGFNIGINIGKVAGAGVEDHIHIHIVPRWTGDTNFMPVFGETKVIPMDLDEAYEILNSTYDKKFSN
jgi:ATP adenylyltransferase